MSRLFRSFHAALLSVAVASCVSSARDEHRERRDSEHRQRREAVEEEEDDEEDEASESMEEETDEADEGHAVAKPAAFCIVPTPLHDGAKFSATISHPYLPLSTVRYAELKGEEDHIVREVQDTTQTVAGVECLVLAEKEYEDGELAEISRNYFAQDAEGNVWYFGEDVDEYKGGKVAGHGGSWLVGRDASEPCLLLPAHPTVGFRFKPENSPPDAEEFDEVEAVDATITVPAGKFEHVLVVKEGDVAGKWTERKFYAAGVGLVSEDGEADLVTTKR
ncbi:MAG: hypothetical protein K8S98_09505 [Planctomycetes bacterium]|nr:hypothetical protein [Planctomycetota bacterium]